MSITFSYREEINQLLTIIILGKQNGKNKIKTLL
jgi:hypothetical protein